jgi:hypothetical protein
MAVEELRQRLARHTQTLRRVSNGKAKRFGTQFLDDFAGMRRVMHWEHAIRDDRDLAAHLDYIHFNPVHPAEWPHSSFRRCRRRTVPGGVDVRRRRAAGDG